MGWLEITFSEVSITAAIIFVLAAINISKSIKTITVLEKQTNASALVECVLCLTGHRVMQGIVVLSLICMFAEFRNVLVYYKSFYGQSTIGGHWVEAQYWISKSFTVGVLMLFLSVINCFNKLLGLGNMSCKCKGGC